MAIFSISIPHVLKWEGGYVNHPNDKGGETKYGITKKRYPYLDIKKLTVNDATKIYKNDFWNKYRVNEIRNQSIANQIMDMFVNHNPRDTGKMIQRSLNDIGIKTIIDGVMGKNTIANINRSNHIKLNNAIVKRRIQLYKFLIKRDNTQKVFEIGWLKRANYYRLNNNSSSNIAIIGLGIGLLGVMALNKRKKQLIN